MTKHKQTWTLLKLAKAKKTQQHFYDEAENRHEHYQKTEQYFYKGTLSRIQLHFGEPSNKRIQIKQASKLPTKKVTENIQSISNKIHFLYP